MRIILIFLLLLSTACATKSRRPAMDSAGNVLGPLDLSHALELGMSPTLAYLKSQATAKSYEGMTALDPAKNLPDSLKAVRVYQSSKDKKEQQRFLRQFRRWKASKKTTRAEALISEFDCSKAVEAQALGFSFELDFPVEEAVSAARTLHEKVLSCKDFPGQESRFRLAIFSIQKEECAKAQDYLDEFPENLGRGVSDRLSYLRSLCSPNFVADERNPWGGYGILLNERKSFFKKKDPVWLLEVSSGSEEWDRLLVTFIELHEKKRLKTIQYLADKLDYGKFRSLPFAFQTSLMVLLSFAEADLAVFQTLHEYLSEHPEMITPAAKGLLFPKRYWTEIVENSKKTDPILVKSLIRQESAFNPTARSPAKAFGLMQLIYPTARQFGVKKRTDLYKPAINIYAGSEFLAKLIEEFGSVELALAAYNAGPGVVRQWQKRYPTNNMDLFVEMIPYSETREYVRLVKRNYLIYQTIIDRPAQPQLLLGGIAP